MTDGFLRGQHMARGRALDAAYGDLAEANATIRQAQGIITSYEQEIFAQRRRIAELEAALEGAQSELREARTENVRLADIAADVPRLNAALREQRRVSAELQARLAD